MTSDGRTLACPVLRVTLDVMKQRPPRHSLAKAGGRDARGREGLEGTY